MDQKNKDHINISSHPVSVLYVFADKQSAGPKFVHNKTCVAKHNSNEWFTYTPLIWERSFMAGNMDNVTGYAL